MQALRLEDVHRVLEDFCRLRRGRRCDADERETRWSGGRGNAPDTRRPGGRRHRAGGGDGTGGYERI